MVKAVSEYCTNCGQKIRHRICSFCGVKNGKVQNFCRWCGNPLNQNASICVKCEEPINIKRIPVLISVLRGVLFICCCFVGIILMVDDFFLAGIVFIVGSLFVLSSPIIKLIKKATHTLKNRELIRGLLYFLQMLSIVFVFIFAVLVNGIVTPHMQSEKVSATEDIPSWPVDVACADVKSDLTEQWGKIPEVTGEILYRNGNDYIVVVRYDFLWNEKLSSDYYWVKGSVACHVWGVDGNTGYIKGKTEDLDYDYNYRQGTRLEELKAIWKIK